MLEEKNAKYLCFEYLPIFKSKILFSMENETKNFKTISELINPNAVSSEPNPHLFLELLKKVQNISKLIKK